MRDDYTEEDAYVDNAVDDTVDNAMVNTVENAVDDAAFYITMVMVFRVF